MPVTDSASSLFPSNVQRMGLLLGLLVWPADGAVKMPKMKKIPRFCEPAAWHARLPSISL